MTAQMPSLVQELPYAAGAAITFKLKKKRKIFTRVALGLSRNVSYLDSGNTQK